jgi:di/tricarboxylate transporter
MWIALLIVAALVTTQIVEGATGKDIVHLWPASVLAAGLMLLTRCMNANQVRARPGPPPLASPGAAAHQPFPRPVPPTPFPTQARDSMDWEVFMAIAFAFAVSTAMEKTKVALGIAEVFAMLSRRIGGQTAALSCIYLVTSLLSELLTNNAAAAIM